MAKEYFLKSTELYNTGGGCMVLFMDVDCLFLTETESKLKQVSYDGDCFVGLNCRYQDAEEGLTEESELWAAYNWKDLIDNVGIDLALDIRQQVIMRWKWTDHVEDRTAIESVVALIDFTTAASRLSDVWHNEVLTGRGYPFNADFEQILIEIFNWQQVTMNFLRK